MPRTRHNYKLLAEYCEWIIAGRPRRGGVWRKMRRARRRLAAFKVDVERDLAERVATYMRKPFKVYGLWQPMVTTKLSPITTCT